MKTRATLLLPLLVVGLGPALADQTKPTSVEQEKQTLESFAAANKTCREWTDGCMICLRHDDQTFACSVPGIACQPTALSCRDSATKTDDTKTPTTPSEPTK